MKAAKRMPRNHVLDADDSLIRDLYEAILADDTQTVERLTKVERVNVNVVVGEDCVTPLLLACKLERLEIVQLLLKAKPQRADVNKCDLKGRRPIWWAARHGNSELADMLVYDGKDKCDVNQVDEQSGCTPLYRAILTNDTATCRVLVRAGADVNLRRLWKSSGKAEVAESPLIKAVQVGNLTVCNLLVNSLAKVNARTADNLTALHYAVAYRRYDIADMLLREHAKVNARSKLGITAMSTALEQNLPAMVRLLLQWGYNVDKPFKWGETPLEMAVRIHHEGCAMTLVYWGCLLSMGKTGKATDSVFYQAAKEGLVSLMKLLMDINPYFAWEDWVRNKKLPLALYKHPQICADLFALPDSVPSLKTLCRSRILRSLGRYGCSKIKQLPLPTHLQGFLDLEFHFADKEKMFRLKSLTDRECPYDCPVVCPRDIQCPDLDFSDSASDEY